MSFLGIAFEAYSPLGTPGRVQKGENEPCLMDDPVVKEIADKHKCTTAQVKLTVMCYTFHLPDLSPSIFDSLAKLSFGNKI